MRSKATPTSEEIRAWWTDIQEKGANLVSVGKEGRYYKLHARIHGKKQRLGQISLGTTDRKIADKIRSQLLTDISSYDPEAVINQYFAHKCRMVEACRNREEHLRYVLPRQKTANTNKSRLTCHLLPFCKKFRITDIRAIYRRDIIGRYIEFLQETVPEIATATAIMKTTKAFLHWYDSLSLERLMTDDVTDALAGYSRKFGYKISKVKTFLEDSLVRRILATDSDIPELRARILAHLVGGLRSNEIDGLRWRDLKASQGHLVVNNAKGAVARYAQYPRILQEAFEQIRISRMRNVMEGDFVFTSRSYGIWNDRIKAYIRAATGIVGKDIGGNCLRRSGCHSINLAHPGLGDKQLGHSANSRITELYYCDHTDFRDVNRYWDGICNEIKGETRHFISVSDLSIYSAGNIITLPAA